MSSSLAAHVRRTQNEICKPLADLRHFPWVSLKGKLQQQVRLPRPAELLSQMPEFISAIMGDSRGSKDSQL